MGGRGVTGVGIKRILRDKTEISAGEKCVEDILLTSSTVGWVNFLNLFLVLIMARKV